MNLHELIHQIEILSLGAYIYYIFEYYISIFILLFLFGISAKLLRILQDKMNKGEEIIKYNRSRHNNKKNVSDVLGDMAKEHLSMISFTMSHYT